MLDKTIKCYGMYVDAAEVVLNIPSGNMDKLLDSQKVVGVYQDPDGQKQVLIYTKKEQAKAAVKKAKSLGFTSVELCPTRIYVPEKDVLNSKKGASEDESCNGCGE